MTESAKDIMSLVKIALQGNLSFMTHKQPKGFWFTLQNQFKEGIDGVAVSTSFHPMTLLQLFGNKKLYFT